MSFGGGGSQQTTQTTGLPGWEQPYANQYLAALLNYVFAPGGSGTNYFQQGFQNPAQAAQGAPGGGQMGAAQAMANQVDPTGTAFSLMGPMIAGSPYLQQMAATNPAAIVGAMSPMAASQLSNMNIYGASNPYLSWIPGFSAGIGGGTAATPATPAAPASATQPTKTTPVIAAPGAGVGTPGIGGGFGGFAGLGSGLGGISVF